MLVKVDITIFNCTMAGVASIPTPEEPTGEDDNYCLATYSFCNRVKFWTGGAIDDSMLVATQYAALIEAGKNMVGDLEKAKGAQWEKIEQSYFKHVKDLYNEELVSPSQYDKLKNKIFKSKANVVDGKAIRKQYNRVKTEILNQIMPHLTVDWEVVGSGKGLRDAFKQMVLKLYQKRNPEKLDDGEVKELTVHHVPHGFQFETLYPQCCILATMVHHQWAGIATDSAEAIKSKKTKSRAEIKMEQRVMKRKKYDEKVIKTKHSQEHQKRLTVASATLAILNKAHLNKTVVSTVKHQEWVAEGAALRETLNTAAQFQHLLNTTPEKAQVKTMANRLMAHTLAGPPKQPPTPESIRTVHQEIIDLSRIDDEENYELSTNKPEAPSRSASTSTSQKSVRTLAPSTSKKASETAASSDSEEEKMAATYTNDNIDSDGDDIYD